MILNKKFNIGDKVLIIDNATGVVIVDDYIVNEKNSRLDNKDNKPLELISFDNKYYFFNTPKYTIVNSISEDVIPLTIPTDYKIELWRNSDHVHDCHVYREYDITELDPEVVNLVNALNKMQGLETVGSCSGHGKSKLFVDIRFESFKAIQSLINIIIRHFNTEFNLSTTPSLMCNSKKDVLLQLSTNSIGESAYKSADLLSELILVEIENE